MLKIILALVAVTRTECYSTHGGTDCKIFLKDLPMKEPLYLTRKNSRLEFVVPRKDKELSKKEKGSFELGENEELILVCPGESNKLIKLSNNVAESHCLKGTRFSIGAEKSYNIHQLECMNNVRATLRPNFEKQCAKTGIEMEIGFEVESEFLPLISLCHDVKAADTIFVEHEIPATIRAGRYVYLRPYFEDGPMPLYKGVRTSQIYSKEYQKKLFERLLGAGQGGEKIHGLYFLARGHLAPHADFLYGTWQWSTYFYANAVPQWQIINAGHWLGLEKYLRKLAAQTKEDLHVITGTYGVLALSSNTGKRVEIYLKPEDKKIRVPAAIFKIVRSKRSNAAIVAICSNNPFEEAPELCQSIGAANNWPTTAWNDYVTGHIYFCDVQSFLKRMNIMPIMKYSRILQGIEQKTP